MTACAADAPRIKIASVADLPRYSYPIPGPASQFVEASPASFDVFAAKVGIAEEQFLVVEPQGAERHAVAAGEDEMLFGGQMG